MHLPLDHDSCLEVARSRDRRFDGWFVTAVRSTGIYCRPSCPAVTPRADNVRFYPSAAAAQRAGYRACKRCRPDASPGSPAWDHRADLTARAMRAIADGVVDRDGVSGLATVLGYSVRQVERALLAELGSGPVGLARAQRAQTARVLLETTRLPMTEVAFAAGFSSIRSFNDVVRTVFATTPSNLRAAAARPDAAPEAGRLTLRLPFRGSFDAGVLRRLGEAAIPGVEAWRDDTYVRAMRLPHGEGTVALRVDGGHIACTAALDDLRDLRAVIGRCRRLLDLDADPVAVDASLARDPVLAAAVADAPGRRIAGSVDAGELAVRVVLGQQVSVPAARTQLARLVAARGDPLTRPDGTVTHRFPTAGALLDGAPDVLRVPAARRRAIIALAGALADGTLDLGPACDRADARARLASLPGLGRWTVETIAMRGLGDPDALPVDDLALRRGAAALGLPASPMALDRHAEAWRPWRSYAAQHLWSVARASTGTDRRDDRQEQVA